ncbi:MAG: DNA polymerase III subunit gamma/tau [Defluviitaleaceae bacterium]|nr:DNA polymerase III subunit gamma/tau [Defluviitaleaceae bacterium]
MSYTVLYRKKRPRTFTEIVGQSYIIEALRNQLRSGQTSHAYLFCGTRGTGKTTAAKIMARAINCEDLQDGNPCNTCPTCESILADRNLDVEEIDAASNNGVDDIRNLREAVKYPPVDSRHRIYIIDEVHMLTGAAFNALLKTLEEPPPHVAFILATTDPQKVPVTILSRCQRYDFKRIKTADVIATLGKYMHEENIPFEPEAPELIAYHSDGAMRDALSLLDQAMSLRATPEAPLTAAAVRDLLGAVDRRTLFDFTDALAASDNLRLLEIIDRAAHEGRDMAQLTSDLIRHLRDALVASLIKSDDALDTSAEASTQLRTQGQAIGTAKLMAYIHTFSEMQRELRFAPHKRTALEVCALGIITPRAATTIESSEAPASYINAAPPFAPASNPSTAPTTSNMHTSTPQQPAHTSPAITPPPATPTSPAENPPHTQAATPQTEFQYENNASSPTPLPNTKAPTHQGTPASLTEALNRIPADWPSICKNLAQPMRSMLARCQVIPQGEQLLITSDSEAINERVKAHQMTIRETLADRYDLATPPNLAFAISTQPIRPPQKQPPNPSAPRDVTQQSAPSAPPTNKAPFNEAHNDSGFPTPPPEEDDWAAFGQAEVDDDAPW